MDSLIGTFHIDTRLLLAQVINFGIVFCVLYFFALKPLIKVMSDRTKKIEKSLDDAKKIEEKLASTEEEYNQTMSRAKKEANDTLEKAGVEAAKKEKEMIIQAKEEIGQIIEQEKAKMQTEKAKTLREIKRDVSNLVIASVEKVLDKKMDSKEDEEVIKKVISKKLSPPRRDPVVASGVTPPSPLARPRKMRWQNAVAKAGEVRNKKFLIL